MATIKNLFYFLYAMQVVGKVVSEFGECSFKLIHFVTSPLVCDEVGISRPTTDRT